MKTKSATLITDNQSLVSAKSRFGYSIPVYDDGYGPLFIHRDSSGISGIVRAQTWEDAYSVCEDEFFPEADETIEELQKEYGFTREHVKTAAPDSWHENELFCEAYGFRPNGANAKDPLKHGIYAKDINGDSLELLTPTLLESLEITLEIAGQE